MWAGGAARMAREAQATRAGLTADQVALAALRIIDSDGLDRLSMRRLGAALGVAPMSLYAHVTSKRELLELVHRTLLQSLRIDPEARGWRAVACHFALGLDHLFHSHPHALPLFFDRGARGCRPTDVEERVLGGLLKAGFSFDAAHELYDALAAFALAHTTAALHRSERATPAPSFRDRLEHPVAWARRHAREDGADSFELALAAMLAAFGPSRRAERSPGPPAAPAVSAAPDVCAASAAPAAPDVSAAPDAAPGVRCSRCSRRAPAPLQRLRTDSAHHRTGTTYGRSPAARTRPRRHTACAGGTWLTPARR